MNGGPPCAQAIAAPATSACNRSSGMSLRILGIEILRELALPEIQDLQALGIIHSPIRRRRTH
jgi:hypothetical protein